jgi:hypothetical protein
MEDILIQAGDKSIVLKMGDLGDVVDTDQLTSINYYNLYGETVTISALLNKVGILKAITEKEYEDKKLELDIYAARKRKELRREASDNGGKMKVENEWIKLTEKSIDDAVILDKGWQVKIKNVALAKQNFEFVDSLYWSVKSKDTKLNVLTKGLTPEEFVNEIVEGKINTIFIKKHKNKYLK